MGVKKLFSVIPARVLGNISLKSAGGAVIYGGNHPSKTRYGDKALW